MFKKIISRLKNTKVLTGVLSGVLLILVNLHVISQSMSHQIQSDFNVLLSIGVGIGIFGNPTTPLIKKSVSVQQSVTQPTSPTPTEQQTK